MKRYYGPSCKMKLLLSVMLFFYAFTVYSAGNILAVKVPRTGPSYNNSPLSNDKTDSIKNTHINFNIEHDPFVLTTTDGHILEKTIFTINIDGPNDYTINSSLSTDVINIKNTGSLLLKDSAYLSASEANAIAINNDGLIKVGDDSGISTATIKMSRESYFSNSGIINLTQKNKFSHNDLVGSELFIFGNYISNGGSLYLNTILDDASSGMGRGTSDLLRIIGDVSVGGKGSTKIYIIPTASTLDSGMLTLEEGILVISIDGTSESDAFVLGRPVVAGNYEYILHQGSTGPSWYLSSFYNSIINYNPSIGPYLANQTAAVQMFQQTLFDRLISASDISDDASEQRLWMRTKVTHSSYNSVHDSFGNRTRTYILQMGGDVNVWALSNDGYFHLGLMGGYGDFKDTTKSDSTKTKANGYVKGYSVGLYGTYFANQDTNIGSYVDMWSQIGWYRNEVSGKAQISTKKYNSMVWSNSVEFGYGLPLVISGDYQWLITPQAQFTYNYYDKKNLIDSNELRVSNDNASGLDSRIGIRFHARGVKLSLLEPFLEINWLNTTAKNKLDFNGVSFKDGFSKDRLDAKMGLQGNINQKLSVSGQLGGQWGNNSFSSYQGQVNINYQF